MIVMQLVCDASGTPSEFDGRYLKAFDADLNYCNGHIEVTADKREALRFANGGAALECWKRQSRTHPLRPDGEPNRPLTAYTVTFKAAE